MTTGGCPDAGYASLGSARQWSHRGAIAFVAAILLPGAALSLAAAQSVANHEQVAGVLVLGALGLVLSYLHGADLPVAQPLTAAEKTYRAFFDHAIEGIFRTTPEGRYVDANPALAKIYGYDTPAALMDVLTDIAGQLYVAPGRRDQFRTLLQSTDVVTDFVSEIRRRDGVTIWISENARAVRDWTGRLVFYEGTVEDVTAKIDADNAVRQALRDAEEANRAKSAFLAAMSHELKTPLNAVIGFSEMLKSELLGPLGQTQYREYAAHIHDSGTRLLEVINNVLDITRLQSGDVTLEPSDIVVEDAINAAIAEARAAAESGHEITLDIADDVAVIHADRRRLTQMLAHLLSNAFKFTRTGGQVRVRVRRDGARDVSIAVADTGIGMAPDQITAALKLFHQIDGSLARRFEGTGLGLPITKALADLHGGRLAVASREGEGTVVTIRLPGAAADGRLGAAAVA